MTPPGFAVGTPVTSYNGHALGEIQSSSDTGIVVAHDAREVEISLSSIDQQKSSLGQIVLLSTFSMPNASIPVHAEELLTAVREVDRGNVRIEKSVEHIPVRKDVDLTSDVVNIERVPVDEVFDEKPESRQEGETLVIPVVEEVLVLTTRYRVIEEVRVTRQQEIHTEHIETDLRRELVDVSQLDADGEPIDP